MVLWRCSGLPGPLALVGVSPHTPGCRDCNAAWMQQQLPLTTTAVLQAVFCSSKLIDALITFGAQNYLEFKLMQGRQGSPWAARSDAAATACFLESACMAWLGYQLDQASAAFSLALVESQAGIFPLLGLKQGHCCKQSTLPGRVCYPPMSKVRQSNSCKQQCDRQKAPASVSLTFQLAADPAESTWQHDACAACLPPKAAVFTPWPCSKPRHFLPSDADPAA